MSVDAVSARIAEIQARIDALAGVASAPAPAPQTSFADVLARTSAATATTAAGPVATAASTNVRAAATMPSVGTGPVPYAAEIRAAAARHGLDPALLAALIKQESGFNPSARSPAGATGLTQLMPSTAASLGVTDPTDPAQAIEGGARYLRQQLDRFGGDVEKALAAYNAGPGAVQRHGGVPPYAETQAYVRKVMAYAEQYRAHFGGAPTTAATALASLASPLATAGMPTARVASSPAEFGIV